MQNLKDNYQKKNEIILSRNKDKALRKKKSTTTNKLSFVKTKKEYWWKDNRKKIKEVDKINKVS